MRWRPHARPRAEREEDRCDPADWLRRDSPNGKKKRPSQTCGTRARPAVAYRQVIPSRVSCCRRKEVHRGSYQKKQAISCVEFELGGRAAVIVMIGGYVTRRLREASTLSATSLSHFRRHHRSGTRRSACARSSERVKQRTDMAVAKFDEAGVRRRYDDCAWQ